jgi:hypothetical protein
MKRKSPEAVGLRGFFFAGEYMEPGWLSLLARRHARISARFLEAAG